MPRFTRDNFPRNAEHVAYSDYEVTPQKPSRYIPNKMVDDEENAYTICPSCGAKNSHIDHGEQIRCMCGLNMVVFGNGLTIWKWGARIWPIVREYLINTLEQGLTPWRATKRSLDRILDLW